MFLSGLFFVFWFARSTATCSISINEDIFDPQPLLLKKYGNKVYFQTPVAGYDQIILNKEDELEVFCPDSCVVISEMELNTNSTRLTCLRGKLFKYMRRSIRFEDVKCCEPVKAIAKFNGRNCSHRHKEFEIGFRYGDQFLPLIQGCFDESKQITLYTMSHVLKEIDGQQHSYPRPRWQQGYLYRIKHVDRVYKRKNQRRIINQQLGLSNKSRKYVSDSDDQFLSRGHLSPKGDFIFGSQQSATFYLINAVPQWQFFNNGNWKYLENDIRNLAADRRIDLVVITGTHGILQYGNEITGKRVEIHLHIEGDSRRIPVPKYMWKIVYDNRTHAGVAFVGLNAEYTNGGSSRDDLCENICDELDYINLSADYSKNGYVYCCEIDDFRMTVDTLPHFTIDELLV